METAATAAAAAMAKNIAFERLLELEFVLDDILRLLFMCGFVRLHALIPLRIIVVVRIS